MFYADYGVVASTYPGWLQSESNLLTGLIDQVGLQKNVLKTVGMVLRPCQAVGVQEYKSYTWKMTGEGRIFKEREQERVSCPECGKELEKGSLMTHLKTQHGVAKGRLGSEVYEEDRGSNKTRN